MKKLLFLMFAFAFVFQTGEAQAWPKLPKGFKFTKAHKYRYAFGDYGTKGGLGFGISINFRLANGTSGTASYPGVKELLADSRVKPQIKKFFRKLQRKMNRDFRRQRAICLRYSKNGQNQQKMNLRGRCGYRGPGWTLSVRKHYRRCMLHHKRAVVGQRRRSRALARCKKKSTIKKSAATLRR